MNQNQNQNQNLKDILNLLGAAQWSDEALSGPDMESALEVVQRQIGDLLSRNRDLAAKERAALGSPATEAILGLFANAAFHLNLLWEDLPDDGRDRLSDGYPEGWVDFYEVALQILGWTTVRLSPEAEEILQLPRSAPAFIRYMATVAPRLTGAALLSAAPEYLLPWDKTCAALATWATRQEAIALSVGPSTH